MGLIFLIGNCNRRWLCDEGFGNKSSTFRREEEWVMMGSAEDEEECGRVPPRKKLRLTKEQSQTLALQLKLKPRQVEVWFQNRRARYLFIPLIITLRHSNYSIFFWVI
ncbi:hypothetical protein NE237_015065 [Protea cynaroides]|uniref:Homeobox domain-containing protein n=1 Tax=Protea cynaroides TaxID=273540 RepID=A0A9Q0KDG3_9MAGN|nr:hypothetical protein NE237_015065 [Protea cynaroides]